jgi:uncharacterized Zn finger protein
MAETKTTRCKRCHRVLADPRSVARGYGPKCAAKVSARVAAVTAHSKPQSVTKALALIAAGSIRRNARDSFYTAKGYRTDATLCTCPAGQHHRECYHVVAARILDAVRAV